MYLHHKKWLGMFTTMFAVVMLAGTMAWAQGSGSKPSGSASKSTDMHHARTQVAASLNAQALKAIMDARVPVVLLDARGPSDQLIPGAIPLAYNTQAKQIKLTAGNPHQLIVTYCGEPGCMKSQMLADEMAKLGYTNVIRFTDGVVGWTKAGYKLQKARSANGAMSWQPNGSTTRPSGGSGTR